MNREAAYEYLTSEFSALESRLVCFSDPTAYQTTIDAALRGIGFSQSELAGATVDDADVSSFLALLDYYTLRQYMRSAAVLTDTTIDGVPINRSQILKHLLKQFELAKKEVEALGLVASGFELGAINLDYLEPSAGW